MTTRKWAWARRVMLAAALAALAALTLAGPAAAKYIW